ncbi:5664_t:CDS:2 [Cetraspora pellucida]|uniref:5664_t:CDS:1 n=1 Tax=Cetraspora pellucida TaxID=1433469 RepID=A0ACA9KFU1_9GLOM|nr:5664_t:CDS:2 [Cetraspora pellucida]
MTDAIIPLVRSSLKRLPIRIVTLLSIGSYNEIQTVFISTCIIPRRTKSRQNPDSLYHELSEFCLLRVYDPSSVGIMNCQGFGIIDYRDFGCIEKCRGKLYEPIFVERSRLIRTGHRKKVKL